ncbi:unnamed protein product [Caenorhabditis auriculariae]|uniref:Serpentine receptor class gamma n=1 Tax=Caenorhabditis auriculariae TaxID=2777116 RepID=A0A8S1H9A8_9PELO|nr:unnamed protein product [Caenorhabditis auriculariae]
MQSLSSFFLCLHRLTCTTMITQDSFWGKYYLLIAFCCALYSTFVQGFLVFLGFRLVVWVQNNQLVGFGKNVGLLYTSNLIHGIIYFCMISTVGIWTVLKVSKNFHSVGYTNSTNVTKKLVKIAVANSFLISGNLLYTVFHGLSAIFHPDSINSHRLVIPFASDMITLTMPYILLAFDEKVQQCFRIRKKYSEIVVIST